jgi:hypothetical protein
MSFPPSNPWEPPLRLASWMRKRGSSRHGRAPAGPQWRGALEYTHARTRAHARTLARTHARTLARTHVEFRARPHTIPRHPRGAIPPGAGPLGCAWMRGRAPRIPCGAGDRRRWMLPPPGLGSHCAQGPMAAPSITNTPATATATTTAALPVTPVLFHLLTRAHFRGKESG